MFNKTVICLMLIFLFSVSIFGIAKIDKDILFDHAKYKFMLEKNPEDPWAHFNMAITYAYMGKVEEGLKELGEVDRLDKEFAPKAIARFTGAVTKDPDDWKARFRLAFAYYFDKQKAPALIELQKVTQKEPINGKNSWAYGYMAIIYGEEEKWDEAIDACKKALKIEPEAAAVHLAYAQALLKKGNTMQAASEAFIALRLHAEEKKYERKNKIKY
ncbi:MAG: tetratricopeptide repeat protein [Candidatus Margulisiibacteriota bacterium]